MARVTDFNEAHKLLRTFYGKHAEGPYTLDRMFALLQAVGNPQDSLRVVHVAGTSGKTSTAYFIAALLGQSGATVGLTVSPHVDEVNERLQFNLTPLSETEFCDALSIFSDLVEAGGILPSYFEFMVAFAYWEFARRQVDYAVVEVGLGGLLDGTNVVKRSDKVCVITDIGLDHTELLGDTIEQIAAQKAGIIQPKNRVFMNPQPEPVMRVVREACAAQSADLQVATAADSDNYGLPQFQLRNFRLARDAASYVLKRDGRPALDGSQLETAAATYIPARMEVLRIGQKTIIVDGSHNAQKLTTLFDSIEAKFGNQPMAALAGFAEGDRSRLAGALDVITHRVEQLVVTSFYSEKDYPRRSVPLEDIVAYGQEHDWPNIAAIEDPATALKALLEFPQPVLVVCGSFYLLNHIRPLVLGG